MFGLLKNCKRFVALVLSTLFFSLGVLPGGQLPAYAGNGVNVILMIGDGMGWEMARAAAVANGAPMYTSGKGSGLNMQTLTGYGLVTTYGTTIKNSDGVTSTGNSALDGTAAATGANPIRAGFTFNPTFNPGTDIVNGTGGGTAAGNLVGYDPARGGPNAWTPITPNPADPNKDYIKLSYPDSANTATTLYTGVKSYNNAMGVDIYEQPITSILQKAVLDGKATGIVTSVPITHATPGAAVSFVNRRNKYDSDLPVTDSILQQAIGIFKPNVLLGGGHPLDHLNATAVSGTFNYNYIRQSTYNELKNNPTSNRYGYRFLERGPNATSTLLSTAATLNPQNGDRLLGLYGARGQDGNLPVRTANGDYGDATSGTGLNQFSLGFTANPTTRIPTPDTLRPFTTGETTAQFIAKEVNENPTLGDLSQAALNVLGKDPDGFWLMIEGGDIDWAAHDNNMDNLIGNTLAFDEAVGRVITWIGNNGGWSKNMLIVTADHDHYLTLNPNFPTLLAATGAQDLTYNKHTPATAGYFNGSDPTNKYGWLTHSNRPVPVYFQGPANFMATLNNFAGQGYIFTDKRPGGPITNFNIPGVPGMVDQVHIYQTMLKATTDPATGPATGRRTR